MSETLAAKWGELVTQALLVVVVPRALGVTPYGEFAVAFAIVTVVSLCLGLGAPLAAMRWVPAADADQRPARARAVARSVAASRAKVLAALTVIAAVIGPAALHVQLVTALIVCAAAWCSVGSNVASELGLGLGRPRVWNVRFPLENALVVVAAPAGHDLWPAHGAVAGLGLACAITFAVLYQRVARDLRHAPRGAALPPEAAAYARLQTITVILGTIVKRGGTVAMPLLGASAAQTGYAAVATGIGAAGAATMMSLLIVQLPRLVPRDPVDAARDASRSARTALLIALGAAIPAALLVRPAIELAIGSRFSGAVDAVVLALPCVPLGAALGLGSLTASLRLRPAALTGSWGVATVVFVATAATAIPSIGAKGAALATTGGMLAACLAGMVLIGGRELRVTSLAAIVAAAAVLAAGAVAA